MVIDRSQSHIWEASTDAIVTKYERKGKSVETVGLNQASGERHERLSGELPSH